MGKKKSFLRDEDGDIRIGRLIVVGFAAIFCLIMLLDSFAVIPTNYTGVKTMFGQISGETVSGFAWKIPFCQSIEKVCNKQQKVIISPDNEIWGETKAPEQTPVYARNISITYRIVPEMSAWVYANIVDYEENILPEADVIDSIKVAMRQLSTENVTDRGHIDPLSAETLQERMDTKYGCRCVEVISIAIGDMDFESAYNAEIAAKSNAQKQYETQLIENETAKIKKEAEAEQKRIEAEGTAQAKKIEAEGEAEAIKVVAEANAEANKLLSAYLSDELIAYLYAKSWNGEMPEVLGSDGNFLFGIESSNS